MNLEHGNLFCLIYKFWIASLIRRWLRVFLRYIPCSPNIENSAWLLPEEGEVDYSRSLIRSLGMLKAMVRQTKILGGKVSLVLKHWDHSETPSVNRSILLWPSLDCVVGRLFLVLTHMVFWRGTESSRERLDAQGLSSRLQETIWEIDTFGKPWKMQEKGAKQVAFEEPTKVSTREI